MEPSNTRRDADPSPTPIASNIAFVRQAEQNLRARRSLGVRISDAITGVLGSTGCVLLHLLLFAFWFVVNSGEKLLPIRAFDPFPFGILTLIVSAEGVFLAIFVLITQNRMMREADRRAHLDLQINLLTEQSSTKILQLLQRMSEGLNLSEGLRDAQAAKLAEPTNMQRLIEELDRSLDDPSENA